MSFCGVTNTDIASAIVKPGGGSPSLTVVADTIAYASKNGGRRWDGTMPSGVGRPRSTTGQRVVFKRRGSVKVTSAYIRKILPAARKVSLRTIERRLRAAGLAWLRRRRKTVVPLLYRQPRLDWAEWVRSRTWATLARWCYTDGVSFYLANSLTQHLDKQRAKLGPMVWRMADGSDNLFEDTVGPSAYWKSQGQAVRVWGLLAAGMLFVAILPAGVTITGKTHASLVSKFFASWLAKAFGRKLKGASVFLVQDHEKALWRCEPRQALRNAGVTVLENYPKCSQDLNPIEICWRELRARLDETAPVHWEDRDAFLPRLRNAVAWLNVNRREYFLHLCTCQKEWAKDVQSAVPPGSRTKH